MFPFCVGGWLVLCIISLIDVAVEVISNAMSSKEVTPRIIVMTVEIENQGNVSLDVGYYLCLVRRFR